MSVKPLFAIRHSLSPETSHVDDLPASRTLPTSVHSGAKSQERKAKSVLSCCKCRLFKILPASYRFQIFYRNAFSPAQWNQDFTGCPGGRGYGRYSLFATRAPSRQLPASRQEQPFLANANGGLPREVSVSKRRNLGESDMWWRVTKFSFIVARRSRVKPSLCLSATPPAVRGRC